SHARHHCRSRDRRAGSGLRQWYRADRWRCGHHGPGLHSASALPDCHWHRPQRGFWWSTHLASAPCMRQQRNPQRRPSWQPLFDVGGVLMNPDGGTVDRLEIPIISPRDRLEEPIPYTKLPPSDEAVVAGRARTVALRDIGPGRAGAEPPEYPVEHLPIIRAWHAARLVRQ